MGFHVGAHRLILQTMIKVSFCETHIWRKSATFHMKVEWTKEEVIISFIFKLSRLIPMNIALRPIFIKRNFRHSLILWKFLHKTFQLNAPFQKNLFHSLELCVLHPVQEQSTHPISISLSLLLRVLINGFIDNSRSLCYYSWGATYISPSSRIW